MPRFVVLEHDHPCLHWDFMLEAGDVLRTWRLQRPPDHSGPIAAEALPDHRIAYLDYEGPVSGNRGEVKRWDAGEYVWDTHTSDEHTLTLDRGRLTGRVRLRRVTHIVSEDQPDLPFTEWVFTFIACEA